MIHLRICRHCYKPLGLDAKRCSYCKQAAMDPRAYKRVLIGMGVVLALAFGTVLVALLYYLRALALYG